RSASKNMHGGTLKRQYTYYLDTNYDVFDIYKQIQKHKNLIVEQTLMHDIRMLRFSYLDSELRSHEVWPPERHEGRTPALRAIKLFIQMNNHEITEKHFSISTIDRGHVLQ